MGLEAKNDGGSGSDTSRDAWLLDVTESRPMQPAAFAPEATSAPTTCDSRRPSAERTVTTALTAT